MSIHSLRCFAESRQAAFVSLAGAAGTAGTAAVAKSKTATPPPTPKSAKSAAVQRKASGEAPHGGGKRLPKGSPRYAVVKQWLDAGMSYSSALYAHPGQSLEEAQDAKLQRVFELLDRTSKLTAGSTKLPKAIVRSLCDRAIHQPISMSTANRTM